MVFKVVKVYSITFNYGIPVHIKVNIFNNKLILVILRNVQLEKLLGSLYILAIVIYIYIFIVILLVGI